jgi:hypothetical protein
MELMVYSQLPVISPSVTLPAFLTGAVWAIADISWFVANDNLSLSVRLMSILLIFMAFTFEIKAPSSFAIPIYTHVSSMLNARCWQVSFPVITSGPGLVGAMWGVFLFGEIKGSKNLIRLAVACFTTVLAVSLIAASK